MSLLGIIIHRHRKQPVFEENFRLSNAMYDFPNVQWSFCRVGEGMTKIPSVYIFVNKFRMCIYIYIHV